MAISEPLKRFTLSGVKFLLKILDLDAKGERDELDEKVFSFLLNPQPSVKKSIKEAVEHTVDWLEANRWVFANRQ